MSELALTELRDATQRTAFEREERIQIRLRPPPRLGPQVIDRAWLAELDILVQRIHATPRGFQLAGWEGVKAQSGRDSPAFLRKWLWWIA